MFMRFCADAASDVKWWLSVHPYAPSRTKSISISIYGQPVLHFTQLLEKTQSPPRENDPEILFLDRGVFDAICWLSLLEKLGRITPNDRKKADEFLLIDDWTRRVSGVIAMSTNPKDALNREQGLLPVDGPGGSIMNPTVLKQMRTVIKERTHELDGIFRIFHIDTSALKFANKPKETCEVVANKILGWIRESIEENILSVPKSALPALSGTFVVPPMDAYQLIKTFEQKGDFRPRKKVEADQSRIQPLPVVIRNRSGHILRLIRKERDATNQLHKKITVWAGGHVRREDGHAGIGSISKGAMRELQEELRIYATRESLKLLGAVYVSSGLSTKKHMAFVYEWRADTDDVQIALCNGEFMEKTGASLQGTFLPPEAIFAEKEGLEDWSKEILGNLILAKSPGGTKAMA
jgi:predicted NUDIX family phosphoesterase